MARSNTAESYVKGQVQTASGINLILGAWLVIAPFLLGATASATWNDVLAGLAVLVLAGTRAAKPATSTTLLSWINLLIGVWLIIAPFVLGYASQGTIWNDVIVGVLLVMFGWWSSRMPPPDGTKP